VVLVEVDRRDQVLDQRHVAEPCSAT